MLCEQTNGSGFGVLHLKQASEQASLGQVSPGRSIQADRQTDIKCQAVTQVSVLRGICEAGS